MLPAGRCSRQPEDCEITDAAHMALERTRHTSAVRARAHLYVQPVLLGCMGQKLDEIAAITHLLRAL